jgi:hypothetical protein
MIRGEALTMRAEGPRTQVPHLGRALRSAQEWTGVAALRLDRSVSATVYVVEALPPSLLYRNAER